MNYFGKTRDDYDTPPGGGTGLPGFDGTIDEVLISCRAYTADEIVQLAYHP